MKKLISIVLVAVLLLSMTSCATAHKDWQEQYDLGMRYLEDGDYEQAILAFSAAIDIDPNNPEAYMGRAEAYKALGDMDKALKDYKRAKREAKNNDDFEDLLEELEDLIKEVEMIIEQLDIVDTKPQSLLMHVEFFGESGMTAREDLAYDDNGRLTEATYEMFDNMGGSTGTSTNRFYYDEAGRLIRATYGDVGEIVYTYDEKGNLLEQTLSDGGWSHTVYTYDSNGILVSSESQSQTAVTVTTYTYNEQGKLAESCSVQTHEYGQSESRTSYQYDQQGTLTGKTEQWAEGTHYTAYTYYNGLTVETMTFDYTPETDYGFRIEAASGQSLWYTSILDATYVVDELNRVVSASGMGYSMDGVTPQEILFYYNNVNDMPVDDPVDDPADNPVEDPEQNPPGQETTKDEASVRSALNALLTGVSYNTPSAEVENWSDESIAAMIMEKCLQSYFYYSGDAYAQKLGVTWSEEDGFLHVSMDQVQRITKGTFGRPFPSESGLDFVNISGGDLLLSANIDANDQLHVQDVFEENGTIIALGCAVRENFNSTEFAGYFRARFRENPGSLYGYTLLSLEKISGNQDLSKLRATASSELRENTGSYYAKNLVDGRMDTAWVEGVRGVGVNEWVKLETTDGSRLDVAVIEFFLGYQKNSDVQSKNGWPWHLLVECEGGYRQEVVFHNYTGVLTIDPYVNTSWVKITILEADAGTKYEDTCITEIRLHGLKVGETAQAGTEEPYGLYKTFFYANYSATDIVYLADVTHDGVEEMIVVNFSDANRSTVYGHVYTVRNGSVVEINTKQGSDYHAGGFFAWYLIPVEESNYYNLATETFGMWQGIGTVTYREYLLTEEGYEIDINYLELDSEDAGNHDQYGMVTEAAWNGYAAELNRELARCYRIYCSSSNGSGSKALDTSPASVFAK